MIKRRRDRAGKTKALILAATTLFARQGYEATTTRAIAAYAGCAEGLIHRYFGGKSGLLFNIVNVHLREEKNPASESLEYATLEEEIRHLMDWQLDHVWREREFLRVAFSSAILQPRLGRLLGKFGPRRAKLIAQRLRRHQQSRSAVGEDIIVLAHALMALSFNFGFIRPAILRQDRGQTRNLARRAASLLSRAVLTP
jgi:AcrR family transcriptional regulator